MFRLFIRIENNWPWAFPLVILSACVFFLGVALISQYIGGHHPCTLCIAQRTSYVVAAIVSGAAMVIGRRPERHVERAMLLGVCGLAFLYGCATAFEHVGVEQGWWPGDVLCSGSMTAFGLDKEGPGLPVNPLFNVPEVTCSKGTWALFGLSMATYNLLANLGLMVLSTLIATRGLQRFRKAG
jgi:disulfide bond formation protein DsbB